MSARILAIEDNSVSMELMLLLLKQFGYQPIMAFDAKSGIELAKLTQPDLVLCDIVLPGVSGLSVVKELRKMPALDHVPIVAVTAMTMEGDKERLLSAGFDGYLAKPIDPLQLGSQLAQLLTLRTVPASALEGAQPPQSPTIST